MVSILANELYAFSFNINFSHIFLISLKPSLENSSLNLEKVNLLINITSILILFLINNSQTDVEYKLFGFGDSIATFFLFII